MCEAATEDRYSMWTILFVEMGERPYIVSPNVKDNHIDILQMDFQLQKTSVLNHIHPPNMYFLLCLVWLYPFFVVGIPRGPTLHPPLLPITPLTHQVSSCARPLMAPASPKRVWNNWRRRWRRRLLWWQLRVEGKAAVAARLLTQ